jgi:hypothetical protein
MFELLFGHQFLKLKMEEYELLKAEIKLLQQEASVK